MHLGTGFGGKIHTHLQLEIRKSDIIGDQFMNIVPVMDKLNHERNRSELCVMFGVSPPTECIWALDLEGKYWVMTLKVFGAVHEYISHDSSDAYWEQNCLT